MSQLVEGHRKDKLKHVKLSDLIVEDRFRKDLGNMDELIESIRQKGIIQPVSIDSNNRLLAGGRRWSAATTLNLPTIPAIIREFVDDIDSQEIELMENIHRKDFTWPEQAKLVKSIDTLYKAKFGSNWSGRKTADLLDKGVATVARNLQLADAIETIPELAEYKTADEAMKVLKKLEETSVVSELRRRQQDRLNNCDEHADQVAVTGQLERGLKSILRMAESNYVIGDVFKVMEGLKENGNIQIIECDPPYGIDLNNQKDTRGSVTHTVESYKEVSASKYPDFIQRLTKELYRVAGKDSWMIFWYGPTWHQLTLESLREAGWHVDEIPAIWAKPNGQTMQPEIYLARGYEPFFLCRKGKPVMIERGHLNVFSFAGVTGKDKYHPTQRPIGLIKEIFSLLAAGRVQVFIPFLGSGATLLACYDMGFQGFGTDLNGEYKDRFMLEVEKQTRSMFDTEKET